MDKKERKKFNLLDTWDGEYQGNIFGPKIALWGGLFILFLVLFAIYRHVSLGVPFGGTEMDKTEVERHLEE